MDVVARLAIKVVMNFNAVLFGNSVLDEARNMLVQSGTNNAFALMMRRTT